jgi:hypothetical protein
MSESMVGSSSEEIPNIRVEDAPSRDEALIQSRNRGATEMMLTFRPRRYDLGAFVHLRKQKDCMLTFLKAVPSQ